MNLLSDIEIKRKGLNALFHELGEANAIRFMAQLIYEQRDYLQFQDTIFHNMSVDEIYEQAQRYEARKLKRRNKDEI